MESLPITQQVYETTLMGVFSKQRDWTSKGNRNSTKIFVEDKVYSTKLQSIQDLKEAIYNVFNEIDCNKRLCIQVCLSAPDGMTKCFN